MLAELGKRVTPSMHLPETITASIDKHILGHQSSSAIKRKMVRFDDPVDALANRIEDCIWVRNHGIEPGK